ncbi:TetR/AcrR family transcriptional regulator [Tengunoibacter tsumagoiensis]|uniref:TetR family transcriptional regulator n=1 Tax=Tengunoibacter tsumagoiensis TaxID=2014871 RepID=A0A402A3D0_9CHLR|nr:TetR/AcrR family transcriptional regulator [Tengunoibacter tsumagoiensis]GCE13549.1 TetR family transcriptional regulator [Tengunoibacter tsumagoiensis]
MSKKRERTRADLLTAARNVFSRKGFHDTSILDITEAADVGVGTFYLHFRDKDEIFENLVQEVLNSLRQQVTADVYQQGEPSLPTIIRAIFYHAYDQRDLFRIALTGGGLFARTFHVQDLIAEGLLPTLERMAQRGLLNAYTDISLLADFITGVIIQGVIWWFDQEEPDPKGMTEQTLLLLSQGLPAALFIENEQTPY